MRTLAGAIAFVTLGALPLCAQNTQAFEERPVTLGLKVGIPVTEMFNTSSTTSFAIGPGGAASVVSNQPGGFSSAVPRYEFGVSAEFHMPFHLRFEVDGLYKRGGFNSAIPIGPGLGTAYRPTTFNNWEIPGLFKYQFAMGHFRPFVDVGASYRHISTITETTYAPGFTYGMISDNSVALHNRNSYGGVAGFGITFKKGPFELTPEARYTRWANESFQITGLRTNLDQGDVLLGISF
jgi:hypothetical protein